MDVCRACNRTATLVEVEHIKGWIIICGNHPNCPIGRAAIGKTQEETVKNWNSMQQELFMLNENHCVCS